MKKFHFLIAASGLILASCAEDLSPSMPTTSNEDGNVAMSFNFRNGNMTKANTQLELECQDFGVWAYKGADGAEFKSAGNTVMTNYLVGHSSAYSVAGIPGTTRSDWFYEKLGNADGKSTNSNNANQYLKYWDLSKNYTAFFAYAPYVKSDDSNPQNVVETPSLTISDDGSKATLQFTSEITMGSDAPMLYTARWENNSDHATGATVPLQFNRLVSRIRLAIYEAVPGYHVKMVSANYLNEDGSSAGNHDIVSMPADFTEGATPAYTRGTIVFAGKPTIEFDLTKIGGPNPQDMVGVVSYKEAKTCGKETNAYMEFANPSTNLIALPNIDTNEDYLSETPGTPSMSATEYNVIPNRGSADITMAVATDSKTNSGIQLVMNFLLVADDTGEQILVKNARAYVPTDYTQWEPNKQYTYVFKITKDVKGTTTPDDPKVIPDDPGSALYPIIFNDVVVVPLTEETDNDKLGNDHEVN